MVSRTYRDCRREGGKLRHIESRQKNRSFKKIEDVREVGATSLGASALLKIRQLDDAVVMALSPDARRRWQTGSNALAYLGACVDPGGDAAAAARLDRAVTKNARR